MAVKRGPPIRTNFGEFAKAIRSSTLIFDATAAAFTRDVMTRIAEKAVDYTPVYHKTDPTAPGLLKGSWELTIGAPSGVKYVPDEEEGPPSEEIPTDHPFEPSFARTRIMPGAEQVGRKDPDGGPTKARLRAVIQKIRSTRGASANLLRTPWFLQNRAARLPTENEAGAVEYAVFVEEGSPNNEPKRMLGRAIDAMRADLPTIKARHVARVRREIRAIRTKGRGR